MSLISCPECNHQVSSTAAACPHCGAPIMGATESKAAGAPLTTVQETSKRLKIQIVFSSIIFWIGFVWLLFDLNSEDYNADGQRILIPFLLSFLGGAWYIFSRFRIWWHHK